MPSTVPPATLNCHEHDSLVPRLCGCKHDSVIPSQTGLVAFLVPNLSDQSMVAGGACRAARNRNLLAVTLASPFSLTMTTRALA